MDIQIEALNEDRTHTRWQSIKKWLPAIDEMNYDPHEYAETMVIQLHRKLQQLETRVNEIEANNTTRLSGRKGS